MVGGGARCLGRALFASVGDRHCRTFSKGQLAAADSIKQQSLHTNWTATGGVSELYANHLTVREDMPSPYRNLDI